MLCCHPEGGLSKQTNSGKTEIYQIVTPIWETCLFLSGTVISISSEFLVVAKPASQTKYSLVQPTITKVWQSKAPIQGGKPYFMVLYILWCDI